MVGTEHQFANRREQDLPASSSANLHRARDLAPAGYNAGRPDVFQIFENDGRVIEGQVAIDEDWNLSFWICGHDGLVFG